MLFHKPDYNKTAEGHEALAAEYDHMAATSTGLIRTIAKDRASTERKWAASCRAKARRSQS
ncbi:hypothetical protein OG571_47270 (plasmid) [Streptomyces sp. NBC_01369]|uniref:hypothetical protein n=1 Tax=Streptomyces sp. NBC_01369 TaxID=2903842 RepID=UPI002F907261